MYLDVQPYGSVYVCSLISFLRGFFALNQGLNEECSVCEATGFTSPVAGCPNALGAARAWPGEAGCPALRGAP